MTDTVRDVMEKNIDKMFVELVNEYDLPHGDFSPSQTFELDEIKEQLGNLLGDFVHQNIQKEKTMKKYSATSTTLYAIGRAIETEDDPEVKEQLEHLEERLTDQIRIQRDKKILAMLEA